MTMASKGRGDELCGEGCDDEGFLELLAFAFEFAVVVAVLGLFDAASARSVPQQYSWA